MLDWFILQTAAIALGFVLDFIIGDPYCLSRFHPICAIGNFIGWIDRHLRRENDDKGNLRRGVITVILVAFISTAAPAVILILSWMIHPILYFALSSIMCAQILAARQLARESTKVQRALEKGDTEGARYAVSMIVGRDTEVLDENGICRAAVETVAENASDGVIAPLFWMMLFGTVGGFFYKSINTMDSMLGYKNDKYLYFGRAAAKTDDFVNFIPARLSALLMVIACPFCGLNGKNAWRIFRRDRLKHDSPNSAQTESACAGALGVRLAGDAVYGGIVHKKEYIGDPGREIEPADIARTNRLMYVASLFMLILALAIRLAVNLCL
ncbi:MAG: adenosylcobinamide-phosphate synthase CbiB [Eubacteriales bacterium]